MPKTEAHTAVFLTTDRGFLIPAVVAALQVGDEFIQERGRLLLR